MIDRAQLFKISDSIYEKYAKQGYEALLTPERVFFCVWQLENDVNHDGFHGYYFGAAGDQALDAVGALRAIGAGHTAEILEAANDFFGPNGPPHDRFKRQEELLNELPESTNFKMHELDEEFYRYRDDLEALLIDYVRRNADAFN